MVIEITESLQVLSILLVFFVVLFDLKYKKAQEILIKSIPRSKKHELSRNKNDIMNFLIFEWSVIIVSFIVLGWLVSVPLVRIFDIYHFNWLDYDMTVTFYVFLCILIYYFIVMIIFLTAHLLLKKRNYKKEIKKLGVEK